MRNVFDQYEQPENKLTHALVCTLEHDRALLRYFLNQIGVKDAPAPNSLMLVEQHIPGTPLNNSENESAKGLPDACLYKDESWILAIEAKLGSSIDGNQLERHINTLKRRDFQKPKLLVISLKCKATRKPELADFHVEWCQIYKWFKEFKQSFWANQFTRYVEILESKMNEKGIDLGGTLTMFDGIHFDADNPYSYQEGKRLIRLMGDNLQCRDDLQRHLGIDPNGKRRGGITGRDSTYVWDFLPLNVARNADLFTDYPHLTMGLNAQASVAAITIPNGIKGGFRRHFKSMGLDGFRACLLEVEAALRPIIMKAEGAKPNLYALQRHYKSQRSGGETDCRLNTDLRTLLPGSQHGVKYQPEWADMIYHVLVNKRSNIQIGIEMIFPHSCPAVHNERILDLFTQSWIAMKTFLQLGLSGRSPR